MINTLNLPQCLFLTKFISGSENIICNICFILNLFFPYNIASKKMYYITKVRDRKLFYVIHVPLY